MQDLTLIAQLAIFKNAHKTEASQKLCFDTAGEELQAQISRLITATFTPLVIPITEDFKCGHIDTISIHVLPRRSQGLDNLSLYKEAKNRSQTKS